MVLFLYVLSVQYAIVNSRPKRDHCVLKFNFINIDHSYIKMA